MTLNSTTADTAATAFCSANGVTDTVSINLYKKLFESIWSGIQSNIVVVLPASTVVTVGSATTQTGPAAPVTLSVS